MPQPLISPNSEGKLKVPSNQVRGHERSAPPYPRGPGRPLEAKDRPLEAKDRPKGALRKVVRSSASSPQLENVMVADEVNSSNSSHEGSEEVMYYYYSSTTIIVAVVVF